jgi:hypothetical protein
MVTIMPSTQDVLHFDVKFVVRRIVSWPRYRREMDDRIAGSIAREIIEHLRLSNWRFQRARQRADTRRRGRGGRHESLCAIDC